MGTNFVYSVSLFSPGQIVGIVVMCLLAAALVGLIVYLALRLHSRGVHRMQTEQLQLQRNELMRKLQAMRSGAALEDLPSADNVMQEPDEEEDEEEDIPTEDDEEEDPVADVEEFGEESDSEDDVEITETGTAVRYNRSFTARITQADNDLKARYSELKNWLLAYRGVKSRVSWKRELFRIGTKSVASFVVRGKTLCLCVATDPALFENTKFKVVDVSGSSKKNKLPCLYKITSDRKTSYAKELVDIVLAGFNSERQASYRAADYTLPYKSTAVLVKRRLIKVNGDISEAQKDDAMAAKKGIAYNRSIAAKIIQSDELLKSYYSKVKNCIMSYKDISCADTWKRETFKYGKEVVAAFVIRGKTLCLCLDADPAKYAGTKYKVEDMSKRSKNVNTPLLYRVKGDRRVQYAVQLIERTFAEKGIPKAETPDTTDYVVPFTATETLVRRGLIRITQKHIPKFETPDVSAHVSEPEEARAEETPAEETPVTEQPVGEAPAEETVAEETETAEKPELEEAAQNADENE